MQVHEQVGAFSYVVTICNGRDSWTSPDVPLVSLSWETAKAEAVDKAARFVALLQGREQRAEARA